ncbi:hypothetical protein PRZ48_014188 [Zasmidium cellare]|uniref:F-box domain-containing protein n=1 Tax=Zasmidium cellare TaxID=395010 RepID=A0ABR0E084_ZASCE|nr:hypothetical protein PRZ48_014188 [Zasmidium cellare]
MTDKACLMQRASEVGEKALATTNDASASTADTPKKKTSFLDLPAEIRNSIYELALPRETIMFPMRSLSNKRPRTEFPGLVMASKQIHKETHPMLFNNSTFHFTCSLDMRAWLRKFGYSRRKLLRNIVVDDAVYLGEHKAAEEDAKAELTEARVVQRWRSICYSLRMGGLVPRPGGLLTLKATCWSYGEDGRVMCEFFSCRKMDGKDTELVERM